MFLGILSRILLSKLNFNENNVQAGLINHICLSFQYTRTNNTGRRAEALQPVRLQCRDWGVGALRGPHSHGEICYMAMKALGGGPVGKYLSFGVVYFDLGDGGGVLD